VRESDERVSLATLRNQCNGSMLTRKSIAWGLSRWADEEATSPARSVPRRCRRIHRRTARILHVSSMTPPFRNAGLNALIGGAATMGGRIPN
jgi:hypothetical protein